MTAGIAAFLFSLIIETISSSLNALLTYYSMKFEFIIYDKTILTINENY